MTEVLLNWKPDANFDTSQAPARVVVVDPPIGPAEIRVYDDGMKSCYLTPERCVDLAVELLAAAIAMALSPARGSPVTARGASLAPESG